MSERPDDKRELTLIGLIALVILARWLSKKIGQTGEESEMSERPDERDNAGVIAPPPLIFGLPLIVSLLVNRKLGLRFLPDGLRRPLGVPLVLFGAVLGIAFLREMKEAETPVDPYKPVANLTTEGPFRYTRNPAYLGMASLFAGISALRNSLPSIVLLPFIIALMNRGVIDREEEYLERRFGDEYRRYLQKVRRWL